jgi:MarR family transcriptional regulator, organic hydroperoxide resistance regulator
MFTLDNFFPYLVNSVTIPIALDFHKKMKPFGITIEKWRVLSVLMTAQGQSVSELARATSIEISRLSHLLNRMARQGLVGRARAKGDGRVVTVRLTPRGRALALKILPMALQYEVSAFKGFSDAERDALKTMLKRVRANLDSIEAEIAAPARKPRTVAPRKASNR